MNLRSTEWIARIPALMWVLCCGVFLSSLGLVLLILPAGQALEHSLGLKALFLARGALPRPESVLVVPIDDRAAQSIGLSADPVAYQICDGLRVGTPDALHRALPSASRLTEWPRCVHAHLIDGLSAAGAAAILFDVTFREREPYFLGGRDVRAAQDSALAQAMARAGNVFLTTRLHEYNLQPGALTEALRTARLTPALAAEALGVGPIHIADVAPPYGRVYLYSAMETTRPSILIQALLFHLRHIYPELRNQVPEALQAGAALPARPDDLRTPGELEITALQLRQLLRMDGLVKGTASRSAHDAASPAARHLRQALSGDALARINFYGPPGTIDTVRYEEVLRAPLDTAIAGKVAGRTVFIGYMEGERPEQVDHFESYFSRADAVHFSGVEIAATALANLIEGNLIRPLDLGVILAAVLLFGFVPLSAILLRSVPAGYLLIGGFTLSYLAAALLLFRHYNLWLPLVLPLGGLLPAGLGLALAWRSARRTQRERQLEAFLGRLLPREVVDRIRQNAQRWNAPGTRVSGACLATDVEGYSKLSERLPADELARLMDRYFSMLTREIARRDGVVSNIAGDEIIGVWAEDRAEEANCRQACEASLAILDAVQRFNREHPRTPLPTRQGVHYGPLSFGSLEGQAPLGAFGDTVNTASRIQNLNKTLRTRILVSFPAFSLPDTFLARDLGLFLFRNKSIPTRVYELLGRSNAVDASQRRLCAEFAVALSACRDERMTEALRLFRALMDEFPEDGPTVFYVQYIAEHPDWNGQAISIN